ncbi:MAG: YkvA family protein [Intrasporangium sp.]|uniref:YkvA family protein n=1 Tax=Intrasporangium sp. TaxID=1925024 RepID=UPI003F7DF468
MKRTSPLKLAATAASLLRATTRPGAPTLSERVNAVPRLVRATMGGTYQGVTRGRLALVGAAVAYVASPVDLLPELVLPVVGLADDALVISWAVRVFLDETDRFLAWELGQGVRARPTVIRRDVLHGRGRTADPDPSADRTGAAADGPVRTGGRAVRAAATDYVLESLRKRLER